MRNSSPSNPAGSTASTIRSKTPRIQLHVSPATSGRTRIRAPKPPGLHHGSASTNSGPASPVSTMSTATAMSSAVARRFSKVEPLRVAWSICSTVCERSSQSFSQNHTGASLMIGVVQGLRCSGNLYLGLFFHGFDVMRDC